MTGFFKQVKIDIPDIEEQKSLINIYDKLTYVQDILSNLDFSVSKLFDKQVIVDESVWDLEFCDNMEQDYKGTTFGLCPKVVPFV